MQKIYAPFIVSSPDHLVAFAEILSQRAWWKALFGTIEVPAGFPRLYVGRKAVPVVFFAKGQLTVFDRQMDFRSVAPGANNGARYEHVRTGFSFDLLYPAIVRIERFELPKPFIKYFNMNWVRIITEAPGVPPDLLLSLTGSGTEMRAIRQANDQLFRELQLKLGV